MSTEGRHDAIIAFLSIQESATVQELSQRFEVPAGTIRKDLSQLASKGRLIRTHGGARLSENKLRQELDYDTRRERNAAAKGRIGQQAAALVIAGDSILIDASTTGVLVGRALKERTSLSGVTVVTSGIWTALELMDAPHLHVILIGGNVRNVTGSITGILAETMLRSFHFDKAFMGAWSISVEHGLMDAPLAEVELKQMMTPRCDSIIGIVDGSKFGRLALAVFAPPEKITTIVTDSSAPVDHINAFRERQIEVIIAPDA